jgi:hypothetical protein
MHADPVVDDAMSNAELVLASRLQSLSVFAMLVVALPVFMMIPLFGGVSFSQVFRALVTGDRLAAGSPG